MHTATMNLTLCRLDHDLRLVGRYVSLPAWLVRGVTALGATLVARKINRLACDISQNVLTLEDIIRSIEASNEAQLADESGEAVAHLQQLLTGAASVHKRSLGIAQQTKELGAGTAAKAADQLVSVCAEYRETISQLIWAILEHDADRAPRKTGYVASTPEEVAQMLERIAAGQ